MRKFLIALGTVIVLAVVSLYAFVEGVHIPRQSATELEAFLAEDYEVFIPDGSPPFATIVGYHGCSGTLHGARDWARMFNQSGYAVVLVESIKPRGLDWPEVCAGKKLWGSERAGDVMVSLEAVRKMPFVDAKKLHLIGWSHGGWSIMDTLDYAARSKRPPNLETHITEPLKGVISATVFYPFCDFPARGRNGWPQDFPVHFIFAESDSIVSNESCQSIIAAQETRGLPVSSKTYANTDHAFDMRDEDFYDGTLTNQPDATREVYTDMQALLRKWSN